MKNMFILTAFVLPLFSCNKSDDIVASRQSSVAVTVKTPADTSVKAPDKPVLPKPVASFKIGNVNEIGNIIELRSLLIQNTSSNADSYIWDFGQSANYSDGVVDYPIQFSEKPEPANIYMVPCMQTVTIKLTAKNKAGDISTTSQSFEITCFRGTGGRHALMHRLY
jgi:hypothetical protein